MLIIQKGQSSVGGKVGVERLGGTRFRFLQDEVFNRLQVRIITNEFKIFNFVLYPF